MSSVHPSSASRCPRLQELLSARMNPALFDRIVRIHFTDHDDARDEGGQHYWVHSGLLRHFSVDFRERLSETSSSTTDLTAMRLPLKDIEPFPHFYNWLYTGVLSSNISIEDSSSFDDDHFESADCILQPLIRGGYQKAFTLYRFAEDYNIEALKIAVMDFCIDRSKRNAWPTVAEIGFAWNRFVTTSKLCKLLVDMMASKTPDCSGDMKVNILFSGKAKYPREYKEEVLKILLRAQDGIGNRELAMSQSCEYHDHDTAPVRLFFVNSPLRRPQRKRRV